MKILIAEDEYGIRETLKLVLIKEGYEVVDFENGLSAYEYFKDNQSEIDMAILDVMMPKMNGFDLCENIKDLKDIPIIILTARSEVDDQLESFSKGADDYISKPFDYKVLLARITALSGRFNISDIKRIGSLELNTKEMKITLRGAPLELSMKEYGLFKELISNSEKVMSREELFKNVWDSEYNPASRTLDVHIKSLRDKLGKDSKMIKTIHGVGFKLDEEYC